jgi:cysteine desulfurase / selenocysteine lyase
VRLIGTAKEKTAILSFELGDVHPHDVGTIMDREGVAVRTGHHCAQPVMERYDVAATVRLSIGLYNTKEEVDAAVAALAHVQKIFSR